MKIRFNFSNSTVWWKQPGVKLIHLFDNVSVSHFSIELELISGEYIYESVFPKSRKITKEEWLTHNKLVHYYEWEVPSELQAHVFEFLEAQCDKWYSIPQLLLIAVTNLSRTANILLNWSYINKNNALICTELGAIFVQKFWKYKTEESLDKIGVHDMIQIALKYKKSGPTW